MANKKYAAMRCRGSGAGCNSEGYRDPTSFLALRNVELEERYRKRFRKRALREADAEKMEVREEHLREREEELLRREDELFAWEELANAIIIQAAEDWRDAKHFLKIHPTSVCARETIEETEAFFLSPWFNCLTRLSGKMILTRLKEEFENDSGKFSFQSTGT